MLILVCKPASHPTLSEWVAGLAATEDVHTLSVERRHGKRIETDTYRFVNQVPLRDGEDALLDLEHPALAHPRGVGVGRASAVVTRLLVSVTGLPPGFDPNLALAAAAYRAHHSTSSSLMFICSPPLTCS